MREKFSKFEIYEYLDNDDLIAGYMEEIFKDGNSEIILSALGDVAKAKGMSKIAEKSGLGRESMYKALKAGAKPRFETIMKIIHALGYSIQIKPNTPKAVAEEKPKY